MTLYQCNRCGAKFQNLTTKHACPRCGLSTIRCSTCGWISSTEDYINNGEKCPKCGSSVNVNARDVLAFCGGALAFLGVVVALLVGLSFLWDGLCFLARGLNSLFSVVFIHVPAWVFALITVVTSGFFWWRIRSRVRQERPWWWLWWDVAPGLVMILLSFVWLFVVCSQCGHISTLRTVTPSYSGNRGIESMTLHVCGKCVNFRARDGLIYVDYVPNLLGVTGMLLLGWGVYHAKKSSRANPEAT